MNYYCTLFDTITHSKYNSSLFKPLQKFRTPLGQPTAANHISGKDSHKSY